MNNHVLSAFAFYGGKALLAPKICDLLCYASTSIYVEPFGGGARVLLNKPRHDKEIYNEGSTSLCTFMRVMTQHDTAMELIGRLHDTLFAEEEFKLASKKISKLNTTEAKDTWNQFELLTMWKRGQAEYQPERPLWNGEPVSDLKIAAAVFVMYAQSRDGMGTHFSPVKFKTQAAYFKKIDRLYQIADRLDGVLVSNSQAELFFTEYAELFTRPEVMAYCDPPYLADIDTEDSKVKKVRGESKATSKDLGGMYRYTMGPDDREKFLRLAHHARCKMVISNYLYKGGRFALEVSAFTLDFWGVFGRISRCFLPATYA